MAGAGSVASKRPILYLFIGLAIGLAVAAVFAGLFTGELVQYQGLSASYSHLLSSYNSLSQQYNSLQSQYESLQSQYNSLNNQYTTLQSQYNSLQSQYEYLQSQYEYLQSMYNDLENKYNVLQSNYSNFLSTLESLDTYSGQYPMVWSNYIYYYLEFPIMVPSGWADVHIYATTQYTSYNLTVMVLRVDDWLNSLNRPPSPIAMSQCGTTISMDVTLSPGRYAVLVGPCYEVMPLENFTIYGTVYVNINTSIST